MAGRYFIEISKKALPRITGLDPNRPCFSESDRANGLQRGDALFVDIIHSNIGFMTSSDPIGDVDFYPNGFGIEISMFWKSLWNRSYYITDPTLFSLDVGPFHARQFRRINFMLQLYIRETSFGLMLLNVSHLAC